VRRWLTAAGAIAALAGGLVAAPSVGAADSLPWPASCAYEIPPGPGMNTVYVDGEGRLIVNPEAAPEDAVAYAGYAPDVALAIYACIIERVPTGPVTCAYQKLDEIAGSLDPVNGNMRYVYPNPNGPGYAVDYQRLLQDVGDALGCAGVG
jgi:hypothetical protein